ncbi:MAG: hypothetical protein R3Y64_09045 [Peptostreptococcaceae bacterium]
MENCCEETDLVLENEKTMYLFDETLVISDYICTNCREIQSITRSFEEYVR